MRLRRNLPKNYCLKLLSEMNIFIKNSRKVLFLYMTMMKEESLASEKKTYLLSKNELLKTLILKTHPVLNLFLVILLSFNDNSINLSLNSHIFQ